jgi:hypothetical protein
VLCVLLCRPVHNDVRIQANILRPGCDADRWGKRRRRRRRRRRKRRRGPAAKRGRGKGAPNEAAAFRKLLARGCKIVHHAVTLFDKQA